MKQPDTASREEMDPDEPYLRTVAPPIRYRRDDDGKRRRVVMFNGQEGFEVWATVSCSGCCEMGESGGNPNGHDYDPKARCHVGFGCDECGYTGKRRWPYWVPFLTQESAAQP
jgi:hypothetical protein